MCISKKKLENCGVVNHVLDRRRSQLYAFNEQIFTRRIFWQNFIETPQFFTRYDNVCQMALLGSKGLSKSFQIAMIATRGYILLIRFQG